jgi:NADH-quinone oxidoreductase subunit K
MPYRPVRDQREQFILCAALKQYEIPDMTFASIGLQHFLVISAVLFSLGLYGIMTRRNAVMLLMGIELVLNAANINFVAFSRYSAPGAPQMMTGQMASLFVIILAACEAAIALAIVLNIYKRFNTINVDEIDMLRD